jgi:F-type H+-transporting ATPase subunit epsilon
MTLHVELVSPERILWTGDADMVSARTVGGGEIAFLTGHAHFVGALDIAKVTIRPAEGPDQLAAVHGGFVEVSNDRVTILSDVAELAEDIDIERARAAAERAEAKLRVEPDVLAEAALRRAHVRIVVAGGLPVSPVL